MGELIIFDPAMGQHEADGVVQRIPGYGEKVEPIIRDRLVDASWPKFLHPFPLSEKYFLTACQLDAKSPWGVYLVDVFDNIVPICVEPGVAMLEPVPLRKTKRPKVIPDKVDTTRKDAVVYMNDVYSGGGLKACPAARSSCGCSPSTTVIRGLRITPTSAWRGRGTCIASLARSTSRQTARPRFACRPTRPWPSSRWTRKAKALQLMRSWFVAMPGENLSCVGCHEDDE
jgi:hypothetical protein